MLPLISLVLATKNSLPHLKKAIDAIRNQKYKNFELIVQDGGSTDGTLEYLHTIVDLPRIEIRSEPDTGLGQAYNRGMARSKGDLVCLTASDEQLFDHSLEMAASWFHDHPSAAAIYTGMILADKQGHKILTFIPESFDLQKIINCDLVPPMMASILNRAVIGNDLYFDETIKACADYDFWLRLGIRFSNKEIINKSDFFMTALADQTSMSFRPKLYELFCSDKCTILDRFTHEEYIRRKGKAGIYAWAAKSVIRLGGISELALQYCEKAESYSSLDDSPSANAQVIHKTLKIKRYDRSILKFFPFFKIKSPIKGGKEPWGYSAQIFFNQPLMASWFKIRLRVLEGSIGICLMAGDRIEREKIFLVGQEVTTYFPVPVSTNFSIVIRNGGISRSIVKIDEYTLLEAKR